MIRFKKETGAQLHDRFLLRSAISMLLLAVIYASDAVRHMLAGNVVDLMKQAEQLLAVLLMINLLPVTLKLIWRKRIARECRGEEDGFALSTYNRSIVKAFAVGFISSIVALQLSEGMLSYLPATFFLNSILALTLGTLSISFLLMSRDTADDSEGYDSEHQDSGHFDTEPRA